MFLALTTAHCASMLLPRNQSHGKSCSCHHLGHVHWTTPRMAKAFSVCPLNFKVFFIPVWNMLVPLEHVLVTTSKSELFCLV